MNTPLRISDMRAETPGDWKVFGIFPDGRKYQIRLATILASQVDRLMIRDAGLPADTKTTGLTMKEALDLGIKLEKWQALQKGL